MTKPVPTAEFLRPREAAEFLGIGRTLLFQLSETDPDFPRKIIITPRCVGWRRESLAQWLRRREGSVLDEE